MIVREIKTPQAISVVNKIKSSIKKDGLGLSFDIPKEFVEKRNYMQSDEFLKDEHNVKMFEYGQELGKLREKIAENIAEHNKTSKEELVQGINGFARIKKYLDKNFKMNFSEIQTFHTSTENQYSILRKFKIGNASREAKNQLGI